jgi:glycosyltransferase involved in cell wall biosynthesis
VIESIQKRNKPGWALEKNLPSASVSPDSVSYPRITIVTPSYNQSATIEDTIRSVILQGYPNLEYIIMDGGSEDGSVDIIKKYEPWITYWESEKDKGQSHAINKGWLRSTGILLSWLNSDDYLEEGALFKIAQKYQQIKTDAVGIIYGKATVIDHHGNILGTIGSSFNLEYTVKNLINPFPQPSVYITRNCLEELGMIDENLHYSMDLDLFLRICFRYSPIFVEQVLSWIRFAPETKTSKQPMGFIKDHTAMLEKFRKQYNNEKIYLDYLHAAFASNYLRSARIHLEFGNKKEALCDVLRALSSDLIFASKKIFKILLKGRYVYLRQEDIT